MLGIRFYKSIAFAIIICMAFFSDVSADSGQPDRSGSLERTPEALAVTVSEAEQFFFQNPDSALTSLLPVLSQLLELPADSLAARAYYVIATAYYLKDYYNLAVQNYERALQTNYSRVNRHFRTKVLNNLGVSHDLLLNHDEALRYYLKTLAYEQAYGSPADVAEVYNNISLVYVAIGNFEAAMMALVQAQTLVGDTPDAFINGLIMQNMGIVYHGMKRYEESMKIIEQAIVFFDEYGFYHNKLRSVLNLAINLVDRAEQLERAERLLLTGIEETVERDIPLLRGYMKVQLARILLLKNDALAALGYLDTARLIFDSMSDPYRSFPIDFFKYRVIAFAKLGNVEGVEKALENFTRFSDERDFANRAKAVEELKTEFSYNEKLAEIQQKNTDLRQQRIRTTLAVSVAILFLFTTAILIIAYRQREYKLQKMYLLNQQSRRHLSVVERLASEKDETPMVQTGASSLRAHETLQVSVQKIARDNNKDGSVSTRTPATDSAEADYDEPSEDDKPDTAQAKPENAELWLFKSIQKIINHEQLFLEKDLSLSHLSSRTGASARAVSATINYYSGNSFNNFVNEYRIRLVIELLEDESKNYLSIDAIYERCGFTHKSTFYTAFDRFTGMTPIQYRKISQAKK